MNDVATAPISAGWEAALLDDDLWEPLKGVVSRMAKRLGVAPEVVGQALREGVPAGTIAHRSPPPEGASGVFSVSTPRAAEVVRWFGFSYEEGIDWRNGIASRHGGQAFALEVFLPDLERAIRDPARGPTIEGTAIESVPTPQPALLTPPDSHPASRKSGRKPREADRLEAEMLRQLRCGEIEPATFLALKKKQLPARFGGKATTSLKVWKAVEAAVRNGQEHLRPISAK